LPKTVTRQRRDCDSNPCSSEPESGTLTTRPPSHPKSLAKSDNLRPSCSDLTNQRWPPSAILDARKNRSTCWGTDFIFCRHTTFNRWRRYASKTEFEAHLWRRNSTSCSNLDRCYCYRTFLCVIIDNFRQTKHRPMTASNVPLTRPRLSERNVNPETPKMAEPYFRSRI